MEYVEYMGYYTAATARHIGTDQFHIHDLGAAATTGREFGHLKRMWHVITYSLSPFEQCTFPNYFSKGTPNVLCCTQACILHVAPPFVAFYLVYTWGIQEFARSKRKNPATYENDK
ncbi:cytochrome b-c1 complex subunit 8-like [Camelus dromedarius]|uniref:cytochrome b-c1 complex subunit 8-like n=1 Tax=Camelus dromedarius TaxID=9838 RepID=UPI00311A8916